MAKQCIIDGCPYPGQQPISMTVETFAGGPEPKMITVSGRICDPHTDAFRLVHELAHRPEMAVTPSS
jgi:hypothetical protein